MTLAATSTVQDVLNSNLILTAPNYGAMKFITDNRLKRYCSIEHLYVTQRFNLETFQLTGMGASEAAILTLLELHPCCEHSDTYITTNRALFAHYSDTTHRNTAIVIPANYDVWINTNARTGEIPALWEVPLNDERCASDWLSETRDVVAAHSVNTAHYLKTYRAACDYLKTLQQ